MHEISVLPATSTVTWSSSGEMTRCPLGTSGRSCSSSVFTWGHVLRVRPTTLWDPIEESKGCLTYHIYLWSLRTETFGWQIEAFWWLAAPVRAQAPQFDSWEDLYFLPLFTITVLSPGPHTDFPCPKEACPLMLQPWIPWDHLRGCEGSLVGMPACGHSWLTLREGFCGVPTFTVSASFSPHGTLLDSWHDLEFLLGLTPEPQHLTSLDAPKENVWGASCPHSRICQRGIEGQGCVLGTHFILIWSRYFYTLYWSEASPSRPRLSPPWDHFRRKRSISARKLSPGSRRADIRGGPPQSPLFWAEWSSCSPFRDLILTPDQTQSAPSTHLRPCSSEQRH